MGCLNQGIIINCDLLFQINFIMHPNRYFLICTPNYCACQKMVNSNSFGKILKTSEFSDGTH